MTKRDDNGDDARDAVRASRRRLERQGDPIGLTLRGRARRKHQRGRSRPGHDGRFEPRQRDATGRQLMVDDPYEKGARLAVTKNVRESSTELMQARGQIDDAQKRAADRFRQLYERLAISRSGAVDPGKVRVDTSGVSDPIPDRVIDASRRLGEVARVLGYEGYRLVEMIAGEGLRVDEAAARWEGQEPPSRAVREYTGKRFREALSTLAEFWGYSARGPRHAELKSWSGRVYEHEPDRRGC